tara:strand:+ start:1506 stop:1856 length:351 start_codon:yes stop_codon:yes gene_type:complete
METAHPIESLQSYKDINSIDFGDTVVFFKFGTEWCQPCKQMETILSGMSNSITYVINVENDDFEEFFTENRIYNIPTTIIKYKNDKTQFVGVRSQEQINKMIHNLKTRYGSTPQDD